MAVPISLSRSSTWAVDQGSRRMLESNQKAVNETSEQVSSGLKGRTVDAYGASIRDIQDLENTVTMVDAYKQSNQTIASRLNIAQSSNDKLITLASRTAQQISAVASNHNPTLNLSSIFDSMLEEAASLLNVKLNGRYIFSGSAIDTAPVDLTAQASATTSADTSYYQGNSVVLSGKTSDEAETLTYGVLANESGYEKLLRALKMAKDNASSTSSLNTAQDLARDAVKEIAQIQGRVGANLSRIEDAEAQHTDTKMMAQTSMNEQISVDPAEAISKVMMAMFQLQASLSCSQRLLSVQQQLISQL